MKLYDNLVKLANETNNPSVTISFNTHRTHPDNDKDRIVLKKLLTEAERRIAGEYGKKEVEGLLTNIAKAEEMVDVRHNLDSLHIFLSNDTLKIIRLTVPTIEDRVYIADKFDVRTIIKAVNRTEEYLILVLSQGGTNLYHAINDCVIEEIKNDDFPFDANPYYTTDKKRQSNARLMDDFVREYFNEIDKALVKVSHEKDMECIVIATEDNYVFLRQVADYPAIYIGSSPIDYNNTKEHQLGEQAWNVAEELQKEKRRVAIAEMKEAVGEGKVYTDLNEIYTASIEGRGELLIVRDDFILPVNVNKDNMLEKADDISKADINDITSTIAWEVVSKNGKVFFTCQDEIRELGDIVLKTRY